MKKILLILLLTLRIYAEPFCESIDIEKIKKLYKKETKSMVFGYSYKKEAICKVLPNSTKTVVLLPYKEQIADTSEEDYLLSLVIAIVNDRGEILQSSFHTQVMLSDAISIKDINIDTKTYSSLSPYKPFGVVVNANARAIYMKSLLLYEPRGKSIKELLQEYELSIDVRDNYSFNNYDGEVSEGHLEEAHLKIDCKSHNYCDMSVEHLYSSFYQIPINNDEFFERVEEPIYSTLVYKNGIYEENKKVERNSLGESNIDTMLKKSKQGYKYDRFDVGKLLFESLNELKKRLVKLNNIAYYLQKNGQNREAMIMLELIVREFPNRTVAYYNLGDAYWALGEKKKAIASYKTYIKQMKAKGKEKRIPKVVKQRVRGDDGLF